MIKAVIFDLDGTICYTIEDLRTAMNLMLSEFGMPQRSVDEILAAINFGPREFVRRSMPAKAAADEQLVDRCFKYYSERYSEHYLDKTYPYDGMPELVCELRARGIKTAVLTNKGDAHAKALVYKVFGDAFDLVLGNCQRFPAKPDPASALWIASELCATPREVLYVGDSDVDMHTARNAGFFACGVSWGYRDVATLCRTGASGIARRPSEILLFI